VHSREFGALLDAFGVYDEHVKGQINPSDLDGLVTNLTNSHASRNLQLRTSDIQYGRETYIPWSPLPFEHHPGAQEKHREILNRRDLALDALKDASQQKKVNNPFVYSKAPKSPTTLPATPPPGSLTDQIVQLTDRIRNKLTA